MNDFLIKPIDPVILLFFLLNHLESAVIIGDKQTENTRFCALR